MVQPMKVGPAAGLNFSIVWDDSGRMGKSAAEITRGRLIACIAERVVWGNRQTKEDIGVVWSWIDLLEYLALHWTRLELEETDPLGTCELPNRVRNAAEGQWNQVPSSIQDHQESLLLGFEEAHNLAADMGGIELPDLWILRQGNLCSVLDAETSLLQPAEEVISTLEQLGDRIAERLLNSKDARSQKALETWKAKRKILPEKKLSILTGIAQARLKEISNDDNAYWNLNADLRSSELTVAARMIGNSLDVGEMRAVLSAIQDTPRVDRKKLDNLSAQLPRVHQATQVKTLANQGYEIAESFRLLIGNTEDSLDPEAVLRDLGVLVKDFDIDTSTLDAICCWGPNHGPAVFVNPIGDHAKSLRGRRFSLAHEICHLLVDRDTILPLGEVLGGRVPKFAESRANAFASEFLLPRRIAGKVFSKSKDDTQTLNDLTKRFEVAKEVVAWQVYNSGLVQNRSTLLYLRRLVSNQSTFLVD